MFSEDSIFCSTKSALHPTQKQKGFQNQHSKHNIPSLTSLWLISSSLPHNHILPAIERATFPKQAEPLCLNNGGRQRKCLNRKITFSLLQSGQNWPSEKIGITDKNFLFYNSNLKSISEYCSTKSGSWPMTEKWKYSSPQ